MHIVVGARALSSRITKVSEHLAVVAFPFAKIQKDHIDSEHIKIPFYSFPFLDSLIYCYTFSHYYTMVHKPWEDLKTIPKIKGFDLPKPLNS